MENGSIPLVPRFRVLFSSKDSFLFTLNVELVGISLATAAEVLPVVAGPELSINVEDAPWGVQVAGASRITVAAWLGE